MKKHDRPAAAGLEIAHRPLGSEDARLPDHAIDSTLSYGKAENHGPMRKGGRKAGKG